MNWRMIVLVGLTAFGSLLSASKADIPPPKILERLTKRDGEDKSAILAQGQAPVKVIRKDLELDDKTIKAKLIIPKNLLPAQEAAGAPAIPPPAASPDKEKQSRLPPAGTVIAGLALSLALGSAVFLLRGGKGMKSPLAVSVAAALILGAYSFTLADIGTPDRPLRVVEKSNVLVVLIENGDEIQLFLDE